MKKIITSALLCCAIGFVAMTCRGGETDGTLAQLSSMGSSCANPTAYGAVLNDGSDDTAAIKSALCSALCPTPPASLGCGACSDPTLPGYASHAICLPAGELDATRPASGLASFKLQGISDFAVYGEGPASVLAMHGSGSGACADSCSGSGCSFHDWYMFEVDQASSHVVFRDLTMTSTGVDGFDKDSTRFIQFGDGTTNSDDLLIKNTRMINACGDDLFVLGGNTTTGTSTTGVRVLDSRLQGSVRRGITVKHGSKRLEISNSTLDIDSNAIDFDPSGEDIATSEVIITNNSFLTAGNGAVIVLSGESSATHPPVINAVVAGNTISGPAFQGVSLRNLEFRNNTIFNTQGTREILVQGVSDHVDISNNTIVRTFTTGGIPVLEVEGQNLASPAARISGNTIVQPGQGPGIDVEDITHQVITNNVVLLTASTLSANTLGIKIATNIFNIDSCQVTGNTINATTGKSGVSVTLDASACAAIVSTQHCGSAGDMACPAGSTCVGSACACTPLHLGSLQIDRNLVAGTTNGVQFVVGSSQGGPEGVLDDFPVIANNDFNVTSSTAVALSGGGLNCIGASCAPPAYLIGGNRGGPVQMVGDGDPTTNGFSLPNGSTYMQRSGSGSAAFFVRENNTWVAQ